MSENIVAELPKSAIAGFVDTLPSFTAPSSEQLPAPFVGDRPLVPSTVVLETGTDDVELESDFQLIRQNLSDVSNKTSQVVDDLVSLARNTESPRAYEVLMQAMNTIAATSKDLLEIHAKRADIKKKLTVQSTPENVTNVQNNVAFVGSTSELLSMLGKR